MIEDVDTLDLVVVDMGQVWVEVVDGDRNIMDHHHIINKVLIHRREKILVMTVVIM